MANTSLYNALFKKQKNILKGGLPNSDNIFSLLAMKKELFFMIFVNLIVQLGITYYIMMNNNLFNLTTTYRSDSGLMRKTTSTSTSLQIRSQFS
jgi:hypothetical protein